MIPAAGFSLNDFFATARFAITVYDHIQLGHSAPQAYLDFKTYIHDFGNGLKYLAEILQEHERHLFNSGARGTVRVDNTSRVQRTLSEVVGDFKTLEENTLRFLRDYKFMVPSKKGGASAATWKKVRVYSEGSTMYKELEVLKSEYMFHTAKVNIVVEPLRILLLSSLETTLIDVQQTVNRIEQLAKSLYTQSAHELSGVHEPVPEESVPMSCESSGCGIPPPTGYYKFPRRSDTGLSDASTCVSSPTKRKSVFSLPGVNESSSSGSSSAITSTSSEWVWLHDQFTAALSRTVGLEQTKVGIVLDEVIRWLEEGRRGIQGRRSGDFVDAIPFVNLCKASWLCGKLLSSHQYQTLDANSLWHLYIGKIAESIRNEFENLKQLRLKLPNIKAMRPPLPSPIFDIGLPPAIGSPGIFGHNTIDIVEQEILRMDLPGYGEMEREVTLVEVHGSDTIRVKDKIGHGTVWTVTPNTLKRSKTTVHPSIPFMQGSGLLQRPHLILKNSDNSDRVGFEFSDYKQLNAFQAALMGYKIVSQLKQVGKLECYYHSPKLRRAKTDVYDQTSVQLWHEQRAHPYLRKSSAYSSTSNSGRKSLAVPFEAQSQYTTKAHRTYSQGSIAARSISAATSSTSSSVSSSKGSHTVKTKEAKIEQSPESSKLVIFARHAKSASKGETGGVEILVMEIDPYTMISREGCCTERKPDPEDKKAPLCCLRIVIEKQAVGNNDGKSLRLLGFREPEQDSQNGDSGAGVGPLGPGLPLNVDEWPEKRSRSQKAQGLAIKFNTELDKRRFIKDFEGLQLLTL
ncbi:hypothetical protein L211DRAFT_835327 [Terfezia boudieri ATCC MYA-4762]|uniref:Uncharacterized protein n=1 Tax=Terfezia boudieri ATCC MYA-4762 TaxID=1051890 RepID=A0A3N4LZD5_9PEZI|nr:hypothetical protein L211DRAFT_835327 [Terfezia boudieri ATCC MYA-4762]